MVPGSRPVGGNNYNGAPLATSAEDDIIPVHGPPLVVPLLMLILSKNNPKPDHSVVSTNRPGYSERGGENPLTTGVKQALPYRTGREARYLSVSTE